jgi:hypothetical protein
MASLGTRQPGRALLASAHQLRLGNPTTVGALRGDGDGNAGVDRSRQINSRHKCLVRDSSLRGSLESVAGAGDAPASGRDSQPDQVLLPVSQMLRLAGCFKKLARTEF